MSMQASESEDDKAESDDFPRRIKKLVYMSFRDFNVEREPSLSRILVWAKYMDRHNEWLQLSVFMRSCLVFPMPTSKDFSVRRIPRHLHRLVALCEQYIAFYSCEHEIGVEVENDKTS